MLIWASEFPTRPGTRPQDVLEAAKDWVVGSPHHGWRKGDLAEDAKDQLAETTKGAETVRYGVTEGIAGLQWRHGDAQDRDWTSEIVALEQPGSVRTSIRINCYSRDPGYPPPKVRKPYIVRLLIQRFGGAKDGPFFVADDPHTLSEIDIHFARNVVLGRAGNSLPVIYLSATREGGYALDPSRVARWFSGMAHTLVEPSRTFSFVLARETNGQNVYGGALGIFWPGGKARTRRFFPQRFAKPEDMALAVGESLREALTFIQPTSGCTWPALAEEFSRLSIEKLRREGSTKVDEYAAVFDSELAAKRKQIADLEGELRRLRNDLLIAQATATGSPEGASLLNAGKEKPFYQGEIQLLVLRALEAGLQRFTEDSRGRHVVQDVLAHNEVLDAGEEISDAIGKALSKMTRFGARERRALEELGFEIDEEGKHVRATFNGDARYMFTIPKTPSDHRSGANCVSALRRGLSL